ncbi:tetratricopeptide repeat protein [Bhargavaea cecembensis]|uniref:tetratricopeptide repeat protein n=1 Tax=Bhargavaea cecembensis TaxID=394098 RepID=UPI00058CDB5C|nr:tetratricopeptide repeat protein [Bhargavaea cecembensis]
MRRKKRNLRKRGNVIFLPGSFERLYAEGMRLVNEERFAEAVPVLHQALRHEPANPRLLGALSVCLYEMREYPEAKEATSRYLQAGPAKYVEAMEMYLSICIQLREYEEVEETISALLDEGAIPPERREKFIYLRGLNRRLQDRDDEPEEEPESEPPAIVDFLSLPEVEQHDLLSAIPDAGLHSWTDFLVGLAGRQEAPPMVITYALILLSAAGYRKPVTVRKLGLSGEFIPNGLPGPEQMEKTAEVERLLIDRFSKDPSKEQIAVQLLRTYRFTAYPFEWPGQPAEEVADAYHTYIESLFDGTDAGAHPVIDLINRIELAHNSRQL